MQIEGTLVLGNVLPGTDRHWREVESVWQQVAQYFSEPRQFLVGGVPEDPLFEVQFDFADVLDLISIASESSGDPEPYKERIAERDRLGEGMLSSRVSWVLQESKSNADSLSVPLEWTIGAVLQRLFVGMTITWPGSGGFGPSVLSPRDEWTGGLPTLWGSAFDSAMYHAAEVNWPALVPLDFPKVWNWLGVNRFDQLVIARTPLERAWVNLLKIAAPETDEADSVFLICQCLEAFLADGHRGARGLIRERLYRILGEPGRNKNWIGKLYDLRSRVAHGAEAAVRPGGSAWESNAVQDLIASRWSMVDQGLSALLAILQKLVAEEAYALTFREEVEFIRDANGE